MSQEELLTTNQTGVTRSEIDAIVGDHATWSLATALHACPLIFSEPGAVHVIAGSRTALASASLDAWLEAYSLFLEASYSPDTVNAHIAAVRADFAGEPQAVEVHAPARAGHFENWARRVYFAVGLIEAGLAPPSTSGRALSVCAVNGFEEAPTRWKQWQFARLAGNPRYLAYHVSLMRELSDNNLVLLESAPDGHLKSRIFDWMWGRLPDFFRPDFRDDAINLLPAEIDLSQLRQGDVLGLPTFVRNAVRLGFLQNPTLERADEAEFEDIRHAVRSQASPRG